MIEKLRRRFVAIAMASVAAVLIIIMGAINISAYVSAANDADAVLAYLAENGGSFPNKPSQSAPMDPGGAAQLPDGSQPSDALPADGGRRFGPETPYDTRFFTALVRDGAVESTDTGYIAAVTDGQAESYALRVVSSGKASGYVDDYRYLASETRDGTLVIFMDNSRRLASLRSFLTSSLLVSAAGMLAVLALSVLLSRRAVRPIAESYEKQKRFITDAGHELKTPLSVIEANTEVLEMTEGESEWTRSIKNQISRLSSLTGDLVALARLDEGASSEPSVKFDISGVVSECVESFRAPAEKRGRTITARIAGGLAYTGREEQIRRLCAILIDNAVKYSTPSGEICVTLSREGGATVLTVTNPAADMARGEHPEFFERFYRADASRGGEGGYGLGLAIAKAICESHKGKLTAVSEDGGTLTMTAVLG